VSLVEIESTRNRALQRYYPWVVIGIAFLTVGVAFGMRNTFAIEEFHWSRGLASGARSCLARLCERSPLRSSGFFLIDSAHGSYYPAARSLWRLAS